MATSLWPHFWPILYTRAKLVPEEIVHVKERLRAVQKKIGDVPQVLKVSTEHWRRFSLFAH